MNYEVGLMLGLMGAAGWSVTLWGRNLFDEDYRTAALIDVNSIFRTPDEQSLPGIEATYGVTLDYQF